MKKLLLSLTLTLGSFYANAQLNCSTAVELSTGINTVSTITGENVTSCFTDELDINQEPLKGNWFQYTGTDYSKVIISSDLAVNVAPKSTDTFLEIFTGDCDNLVCYDYAGATSSTNGLTTYELFTEPGVTYYLMWSSALSNAGFDFNVKINTCAEPTTVFLNSNVTTNSATLEWEAALGNPNNYEVLYVNIETGEELSTKVDTNMADLTDLVPYGNYYFYIRSLCTEFKASDWSGPYLLSLLKEVPYACNFDTQNENAGWTMDGDYAFGLITDSPAAANSKDNFYAFFNKFDGPVDNWLFSPAISLTKGQVINTSFFVASNSPTDRSVKITLGFAPSIADQTTTIYSNTAIKSSQYTKMTSPDYTVEETGVYYFGINDFSISAGGTSVEDERFMLIDTFSINLGTLTTNDFVSNQFSVFPNPVKNTLNITNTANFNVSGISLTDLNGRIVKKQSFNTISNVTVNISDLAAGVYLLNISSDKGTATKKIIKN